MSLTKPPPGVFQERDVDDQELDGTTAVRAGTEFHREETHGIALWPQHRLLADSRGLGWHDAYLSLATEAPWTKTLPALPHYCLAYCTNRPASVTREIPGERRLDRVELRPRLFGVIPADRPSTWKLVGSPDIELVYLRRGMVDRLAEEVFGVDGSRVELLPKLGFFDGMLEQLVLGLLDAALAEDGGADGIYADHLVRMITLHVLRCHSSRPLRAPTRATSVLRRDRMSRVRELIEEALDEDLSLERLATEAGIGTHAFSAAFVPAVGVAPHRYVVQRRIERAKRLLRESELPVATIAAQTGFASQSHLATVFKRTVGVTPGQYHRGERSS